MACDKDKSINANKKLQKTPMMSGSGSRDPETSSRVFTLTQPPTVRPPVEGSRGVGVLSLTLLSDPGPSLWHRTRVPGLPPAASQGLRDPVGSV